MTTCKGKNADVNGHIVFIDEDTDTQTFFRSLINTTHKVDTASNPKEALQLLHKSNVNYQVLVLGDMSKADNDIEIILHAITHFPNIVRVLASSQGRDSTISTLNMGGFSLYIPRPWNGTILNSIIEEAVNMSFVYSELDAPQLEEQLMPNSWPNETYSMANTPTLPDLSWESIGTQGSTITVH